MLILWTAGSAAHALFDSFLWYMTSCACCENDDTNHDGTNSTRNSKETSSTCVDKSKKYCNVLVTILVLLLTGAATMTVMIRAMIDDSESGADNTDAIMASFGSSSSSSTTNTTTTNSSSAELEQLLQDGGAEPLSDKNNYIFVQAYAIELALAWFAWFFLWEGIIFSGILSCGGRVPGMGGRPAEVREEQERNEEGKKAAKQRKTQLSKMMNTSQGGSAREKRKQMQQSFKSRSSSSKKGGSKTSSRS